MTITVADPTPLPVPDSAGGLTGNNDGSDGVGPGEDGTRVTVAGTVGAALPAEPDETVTPGPDDAETPGPDETVTPEPDDAVKLEGGGGAVTPGAGDAVEPGDAVKLEGADDAGVAGTAGTPTPRVTTAGGEAAVPSST